MTREEMKQLMLEKKIVTIVRGIYGEDCLNLAKALYRGGIRFLEVTFDLRHPESQDETTDTIRLLTKELGDRMIFGAGTVTTVENVERTFAAGGRFIVSPDTRPEVIRRTRELGMISTPGAMTPTEIGLAYDSGADIVKLFPASVLGPDYVKAVRGPWSQVPLLVTGGISEANAADFLKAGAVGMGVGGNLAKKALVDAGRFDEIEDAARRLVAIANA